MSDEAFRESCLRQWRTVTERLGGVRLGARPTTTWATVASIHQTLGELAQCAPANALLFPTGDHLPLSASTLHRSPGCLELRCGNDVTVTRVVSLKLELIAPDPEAALAYFRLETGPLLFPTGPEPIDQHTTYARSSGERPAGVASSLRRFAGAFLFVAGCSPVLRNADVLAAVHNSHSPARFRELIGALARRLAPTPVAVP